MRWYSVAFDEFVIVVLKYFTGRWVKDKTEGLEKSW